MAAGDWTRPQVLSPAPGGDVDTIALSPVVTGDGRAVVAWRSASDEATPDRLFALDARTGRVSAPVPSPLVAAGRPVALEGPDALAALGDDRIVALADDPRSPATRIRFGLSDAALRPAGVRTLDLHGEPRRPVVRASGGHLAIAALVAPEGATASAERVVVATGPADGRLVVRRLSAPGGIADFAIDVGASGDVAAVWSVERRDEDGRSRRVFGRTMSADGRTGPIRALGPWSETIEIGSVDVDRRGRSAATWIADATPVGSIDGDLRRRPWVARARRRGALVPVRFGDGGRPLSSDRPIGSADAVAATFADSGGLVLAVEGHGRVSAGPLRRSGRLQRLSPRGHPAAIDAVAGAGGRTAVAWSPVIGADAPDLFAPQPSFVSVRGPGGRFAAPHRLGTAITAGPTIAVSPDGRRVVAAWLRGDHAQPRVAELLP